MGMNYQEQITVSFIDELEKIGEATKEATRAGRTAMQKLRGHVAKSPTKYQGKPATSSLREAADAIDKVKVDSTAADIMKGVNAATAKTHASSAAADAAKPDVAKPGYGKAALIGGGAAAVGAGAAYAAKKHRER